MEEIPVPEWMAEWTKAFIRKATQENEVLRRNGAEAPAIARGALLQELVATAEAYMSQCVDTAEAAAILGVSPETVRRAVREERLPCARASSKGRIRLKLLDVITLAGPRKGHYDPLADAQDIAKLRRSA